MAAPVIGICAALERASFGMWDQLSDLLPRDYTDSVQRAGALALMLPVQAGLADEPDQALDRVDALLLAGGADLDPASYGAARHPQTTDVCPQRDSVEIALARRAIERGMPVLGICRGMQLLNVVFGGTLRQHVPDLTGSDAHRSTPGKFSDHRVRLTAGSLAARAAGQEDHAVRSHHHQAIDTLGAGLVITGYSEEDGLAEAVESPDHGYLLGVQWHPEADPASSVVASLVDEVRSRPR